MVLLQVHFVFLKNLSVVVVVVVIVRRRRGGRRRRRCRRPHF